MDGKQKVTINYGINKIIYNKFMERGENMWKILNTYEEDFLHSIQKYFSTSDEEFDKFLYKKGNINSSFSLPKHEKVIQY